jgi:hypothetical protein
VTGEGAGEGSVIANVPDWPSDTLVFAGTPMAPALATVTVAVASGILGKALAWITVVPNARPVTGTFTVVAPVLKLTVAGTVAVAGVLELRLMVTPPAGAALESVRVRFCVVKPAMVAVLGVKLTVAFT